MKKIFTKISLLILGLMLCAGNAWADAGYHDNAGNYYEVTTANGVTYRVDYTYMGYPGVFDSRSIVTDNGAQYAYITALPNQYVIQLDRTITFNQGQQGNIEVTVAIKPGTFTSFNGVIILPDWENSNQNKNVFYVKNNYTDTDQHPSYSDVFGSGAIVYAKTTHDCESYNGYYKSLYLKDTGYRLYYYWQDHISALYSGPGTLVDEGDFGTSLHWAYYDNDSLAITGTGAMPDYASVASPATPWAEYITGIRFVGIASGVTKIGNNAFYLESGLCPLKSVRFAAGSQLTEIGSRAFGYTKIASIELPSGLTTIGDQAFIQCDKLESITLPASVATLGYGVFDATDIMNTLTVGNATPPTINKNTNFFGGAMATIVIPDESICDYKDAWGYSLGGTYVYKYSAAGEEVECAAQTSGTCGTNLNWSIDGGVLTISGTGTTMTDYNSDGGPWNENFKTDITSVVIEAANLTNIGNNAFRSCTNLATVTLGASVTTIGTSAFDNCSAIAEPIYNSHVFVKMPNAWLGTHGGDYVIVDGTELIYSYAFEDCTNLTSITMPDDVTTIGSRAFYGCSNLASVTLGNNVTTIGNRAFEGCTALTTPLISGTKFIQMFPANYSGKYIIPDGIVEIVGSAFSGCTSLTSVILPNTVTTIGNYAFYNCTSLASVSLGASVATIGTSAFANCPLTSPLIAGTRFIQMFPSNQSGAYSIPNGITTISANAFKNCTGLTSVIIPNSVTNIGTYAFQDCSNLISVTLPSGMSSIPTGMFYGCEEITEIHMKGKVPSVGDNAFSIWGADMYVPKGTYDAYVAFVEDNFYYGDVYEENTYGDATAEYTNASLVASASAHESVENFTIVRPIQANGYLNTICLPFDLNEAQIANSDLAEAEIFAFDAQNTGAEIEMVLNEVTEMEAGMPYFFRYPNGAADAPNMTELNFHDVTVKTATSVAKTVEAGTFRLKGTLQNTLLNSSTNYLFLGAEDALFYPDFGGAGVTNDDLTLRPFRAYFEATGGANLAPARIKFGRNTATDVEKVQEDNVQSTKVLQNGQLFIIKNGVKYNAQGQIVK